MDPKPPNIVLPIAAAFIGLVTVVWAVTFYGSQQIETDSPLIISREAPQPIVQPIATTTENPPSSTSTEGF